MTKRDKESIAFRNCMKKTMGELKGLQARRIDISIRCAVEESRIRSSHERCIRAIKTYVPIRVSCLRGGLAVSFFIDNDIMGRLDSVRDAEDMTGMPKEMLYSLRLSFVGDGIDGGPWSVKATPLEAIDASLGLAYSPEALADLLERPEGLPTGALCVSLEERMRYFYRTLLSFLTVCGQERLDGIGLAMLHASLEAGFRLGLPIAPKDMDRWIERFGLDANFKRLAEDSYEFILFENYLTSMFPELPLAERDMLQPGYKEYLKEMREGRFEKAIPERTLGVLGMGREEVKERERRIGLLYG